MLQHEVTEAGPRSSRRKPLAEIPAADQTKPAAHLVTFSSLCLKTLSTCSLLCNNYVSEEQSGGSKYLSTSAPCFLEVL